MESQPSAASETEDSAMEKAIVQWVSTFKNIQYAHNITK
jgi:hypothetical protein